MLRRLVFAAAVSFSLLLSACATMPAPIENVANRAIYLPFGMHITPDSATNPIEPPERFSGYHVGLDLEVSGEERETDVPAFAICAGSVVSSGFAEGYGGLLVQRCTLDDEPVTVLYGHLSIDNLPAKDAQLAAGQRIGILADANSRDSGGNRKHLHLGIHRGTDIDIRGYVQTEREIAEFIDPLSILRDRVLVVPGQTIEPYWRTSK